MGFVEKLLAIIKGLTLSNVLVLGLVLALLFPAYVGWKAVNNPQMLGILFSEFKEINSETDCLLSYSQPSGAEAHYSIRAVLAERNRETWYVTVRVRFKPDDQAMEKYCGALVTLVDRLSDPSIESPKFPDSNRKIVGPAWPRPP